jgi:hypothetical protein
MFRAGKAGLGLCRRFPATSGPTRRRVHVYHVPISKNLLSQNLLDFVVALK